MKCDGGTNNNVGVSAHLCYWLPSAQQLLSMATIIFNPLHVRHKDTILCLSVCLSVTTLAATYLVYMSNIRYHRVKVYCLAFTKNTYFNSSGVIC